MTRSPDLPSTYTSWALHALGLIVKKDVGWGLSGGTLEEDRELATTRSAERIVELVLSDIGRGTS